METTTEPLVLTPADCVPISSPYLAEGRKSEHWEIGDVRIEGEHLSTVVRMTSTYLSATDEGGFHLSFVTCLEFLSQLMIIHAHAWAGLDEKRREGWMLESVTRNSRPIRDPGCINVDMQVDSIRRMGEKIFSVADFRVTDRFDGLFKVRLKAMLA